MGKHGVLLRIFKQYHIEWIWYLSKEMRYLIFFAAGIFAIDQLFKHAIDEEPKENFPRDLPGSKGLYQLRIFLQSSHGKSRIMGSSYLHKTS